jgi:hypothetical protein
MHIFRAIAASAIQYFFDKQRKVVQKIRKNTEVRRG